jgi:hypothetical protein
MGGKSASSNKTRKPWPQYGGLNANSRIGRNLSDYVDLGPAFAEAWPSKSRSCMVGERRVDGKYRGLWKALAVEEMLADSGDTA